MLSVRLFSFYKLGYEFDILTLVDLTYFFSFLIDFVFKISSFNIALIEN